MPSLKRIEFEFWAIWKLLVLRVGMGKTWVSLQEKVSSSVLYSSVTSSTSTDDSPMANELTVKPFGKDDF